MPSYAYYPADPQPSIELTAELNYNSEVRQLPGGRLERTQGKTHRPSVRALLPFEDVTFNVPVAGRSPMPKKAARAETATKITAECFEVAMI